MPPANHPPAGARKGHDLVRQGLLLGSMGHTAEPSISALAHELRTEMFSPSDPRFGSAERWMQLPRYRALSRSEGAALLASDVVAAIPSVSDDYCRRLLPILYDLDEDGQLRSEVLSLESKSAQAHAAVGGGKEWIRKVGAWRAAAELALVLYRRGGFDVDRDLDVTVAAGFEGREVEEETLFHVWPAPSSSPASIVLWRQTSERPPSDLIGGPHFDGQTGIEVLGDAPALSLQPQGPRVFAILVQKDHPRTEEYLGFGIRHRWKVAPDEGFALEYVTTGRERRLTFTIDPPDDDQTHAVVDNSVGLFTVSTGPASGGDDETIALGMDELDVLDLRPEHGRSFSITIAQPEAERRYRFEVSFAYFWGRT